MFPARRVSLAWSNLTHSKLKLAGALAGTSFAVALMFMEMGFQNAMLDSVVVLAESFDADLVLVGRSGYTMNSKNPFPRRRLQEVARDEEVARVSPVYFESVSARWRNPATGGLRPIRVVAFRPGDAVFVDPELNAWAGALRAPDAVLFDRRGKSWIFGDPRVGTITQLAGRPARIVGEFALGADLVNDGNLLMSDRNYLKYFPDRRLADPDLLLVDLGLVKLRPGADPARVVARAELPEDVALLTKTDWIRLQKKFWNEHSPIGFVFQLGLVMGFVVGAVICYQILYGEISSYIREYATLQAIGYRRGDLVRVVLLEATYLAALGYLTGATVSAALYWLVGGFTRMPFRLGGVRLLWVLVMTLVMCLTSAALAIRKLWGAAPADLF